MEMQQDRAEPSDQEPTEYLKHKQGYRINNKNDGEHSGCG
jgi:hypothetical protein